MKASLKLTTSSVTKQTSTDTKNWSNPCILSDHHGLKLELTLIVENLQTHGN